MSVLEQQFDELLDSTISQHGYWLINHSEVIESNLKSGIVTHGLKKMIVLLNDINSQGVKHLYKMIEQSKDDNN